VIVGLVSECATDSLVLGTSLMSSTSSDDVAGMISIALQNDFHFWATSRMDAPQGSSLSVDKGDWMRSCSTTEEEAEAEAEQCPVDTAAVVLKTDTVDAELALCSVLAQWTPWSTPSAELCVALKCLSAASAAGPAAHTTEVRQAVVDLLTREAQASDSMLPHQKYQKAEQLLRAGYSCGTMRYCPQLRAKRMQHIMRVSATTSLSHIEKRLAESCSQGSTSHPCLTVFRANPGMVRNWRLLWWSVPTHRRHELLLEQFVRFPNDYIFLGVKVCRKAFMQLTGTGASTIVDLKAKAVAGDRSVSSLSEKKLAAGICNLSKPKRYLDCAQWVQVYAESHGEQSPMTGQIFLPAGRKLFYYAQYLHDRSQQDLSSLDGHAGDHRTFLKAWQTECFYITIAKSESMFTRCGCCEFLKALLDSTPRSNPEMLCMVRARLGAHFAFQSAQRLEQGRVEERCRQSGGKEWPGTQLCSWWVCFLAPE
jgi:hypothetical protein